MGWIYLFAAGVFEIGFTTALRYTEGFSRVTPTAIFILCILASFACFEVAIRDIPLGTAYAIWAGIGAAGTVILGIFIFGEPVTFWRMFFMTALIASIIGLKLVSN